MWRAQEVDGRIAAKNAVKIRAALRQSIDAKRIYAQYQETQPAVTDNPTQDRTRARAWAIMNVRFNNESLRTAMTRLYAEAWVTGDLAARAALLDMRKEEKALTKANDIDADVSTIDWDSWQPGDTASAMLLDPPQAFQNLVQRSGNLISGLDKTGYEQIGTALADAIRTGMPPGKAAKLIQDAVGSPARALTIAVTENSRVMNAAAVQRYKDAGIKQMKWMAVTAVGGAPCEKCASNIGQVVEIGASFNSGHMQPPAHPHCRCNLLPEMPDYEGYLNSLGYQVSPTDGGMTQVPKPKKVGKAHGGIQEDELLQVGKTRRKASLSSERAVGGDPVLREAFDVADYNGLPTVLSPEDFEKAATTADARVYRGISPSGTKPASELAREYLEGDHYAGYGIHGNGTYTSTVRRTAEIYSEQGFATNKVGDILDILIPDTGNYISHIGENSPLSALRTAIKKDIDDEVLLLKRERFRLLSDGTDDLAAELDERIEDLYAAKYSIDDNGVLATLGGYDGIIVETSQEENYYIILNRAKVIVKGKP